MRSTSRESCAASAIAWSPRLEHDRHGGVRLVETGVAEGLAVAEVVGVERLVGAQHVLDLVAALDGLDVPGEGDEVAPIALGREHFCRGFDVASRERGFEFAEESGCAGLWRGV